LIIRFGSVKNWYDMCHSSLFLEFGKFRKFSYFANWCLPLSGNTVLVLYVQGYFKFRNVSVLFSLLAHEF
jgi:hypothetical protein